MIARLAQRYWELHGGNAVLNWLQAERTLQDLLRGAPIHTPIDLDHEPASARDD